MLNTLEERILQYIISQNQNSNRSVAVRFDGVSLEDTIESIKSLTNKGLVRNCSSLIGASAMLLRRGKYYFEQKEKTMYGVYYDKIKLIESYIEQLQALKLKDSNSVATQEESYRIEHLIREVITAFNDELSKETVQSFNVSLGFMPDNVCTSSYYNEIDRAIACLKKIAADTKIAATKGDGIQFNISQNQSQIQSQSQSIEITFSQVLSDVQNKGLSAEDMVELTKLLTEFENERQSKKKPSLWDKAKNVLKYLCDKSIEIGIAVLPYIVGALNK